MKIYGLDFTSAPSYRKPITCAACILRNNRLRVSDLKFFGNFTAFEAFLSQPGPWLAGLDFPFGQPQKLIQNLDWPADWSGYVTKLALLSQSEFAETLAAYRRSRPPGDKQHLRLTDTLAQSRSPMMWYGVPVGRMFFEGAPRLLNSGVSILPCRPTPDNRIVVEAYPALVARRWTGQQSYKSDAKRKQTQEQAAVRQDIMAGVCSDALRAQYGFSVELSDTLAMKLIQDPTGDQLDAVLCAIQAAWAYGHRFPIPPVCNPAEGWIFDPKLL